MSCSSRANDTWMSTVHNNSPDDIRNEQKNLRITEKEWRRILNEDGIDGVLRKMNEIDQKWRKQPVLVAVIGQTGSGKSTVIRRFLGFAPDDPRDPQIGCSVEECTKSSKEYPVPNTGLVYLDLPGVGSTTTTYAFTSPKERDAYCQRFRLTTIDYFLLLSNDKLNDQDSLLAQYITQNLKKKFIFVQTKVDELRREYGNKKFEKEQDFPALQNKIRTDIQRQLGLTDSSRIFLISNEVVETEHDGKIIEKYDQSPDYEFDQLVQQIQKDMLGTDGLTAEKANAFILATNAKCRSAIKAKATMLRQQAWGWSTISGLIGAVPLPGVSMVGDTAIVISRTCNYLESFGLEPRHYLGDGNTAAEKMRKLFTIMGASLGPRALATIAVAVGATAVEEGTKSIPVVGIVIGSILGAGISFGSTLAILRVIIDFCEEEALKVIA